MSWYDNKTDFWHLVGDPAGYVTGINKGGFGGIKNMLSGDPDAAKKALDQATALSQTGSQNITNFLMGQQAKAQQFYKPLQHMFDASYGTEGIQAPQAPMAPGVGPLAKMYGGG